MSYTPKNPGKSRFIRNHVINPAGSRNHGTGLDGTRGISKFTGLHGTGHGFPAVYPNFTGLVCTGSGFEKHTHRTGSGSRIFSLDQFGRERNFQNPRDHGIIPYLVESCRILTAGKKPEENPGIYNVCLRLFTVSPQMPACGFLNVPYTQGMSWAESAGRAGPGREC